MESRPSTRPSSSRTATRIDETSAAYKESLREKLDLWSGDVLSEIHPEACSRRPADRIFEPRDQHCGIWEDALNKECHASFGDQGTTASVSCYGDLMQMSQFLGAGHSGVFSIDHMSTDEPYYIESRAEGLHDFGLGQKDPTFGAFLPAKYWPDEAPRVKWVNWRWPRYEWNISGDGFSVKVSFQWLVKSNTVFQQIVVTNKGLSPIEDFWVRVQKDMLIRDLDYLEAPSYNEHDSKTHIRGRGPNELSWITMNVFNSEESVTSQKNAATRTHVPRSREFGPEEATPQPSGTREEAAENKQPMSSSKPSCGSNARNPTLPDQQNKDSHQASGSGKIASVNDSSTNQHQADVVTPDIVEREQDNPPKELKGALSDNELWQKRRISDTWSATDANAVVAIMSLYVNGTAQKMEMESHRVYNTLGASGSGSDVLEITVAYRAIAIPKDKIHWGNFLIPAETADVSAMLSAETEQIWGHSITENCECSNSLCDLGISMVDLNKGHVKQSASGEGQISQDAEYVIHNTQKSNDVHEDTTTIADQQVEVDTGAQEASTASEPSKDQTAAQDTSGRPITGVTVATSRKFSPINSAIEYLTWRHTEHILSVCIIPLSSPVSLQRRQAYNSATPGDVVTNKLDVLGATEAKETELEVPLALTCGDMSGHRICTSASFFAFDFLIGVLRRLPSLNQTPYVISLQQRIDAACCGHIRWLEWLRKPWLPLKDTESLLYSGSFAANYWVNGRINSNDDSATWQPVNAITDTPFQILKVTTYVEWCQKKQKIQSLEDDRLRYYMALLRDVWVCMIHELDDLDKRKSYAWPHINKDGVNTYRLDDHVWLWRSLNELHYLDLWGVTDVARKSWEESPDRWISNIYSLSPAAKMDEEDPTNVSNEAQIEEAFAEFSAIARRLSPEKVQKAVLQRFTVENDVSQERMLAVTRSARETRFFFHTRDTALLYREARKFFRPDTSFSELWRRTIKSQSHHEEALEEEWRSPLRFALGAMAGLSGFSIDKRSPAELTKHSVEALIQCSAHNAFIPGEIDAANRKPAIFTEERDRDYYYHVGFEACHILLEYAEDIDLAFESEHIPSASPIVLSKQVNDNTNQPHHEMYESLLGEMLAQPKKRIIGNLQHSSDERVLARLLGADGRLDRKRTAMIMKRSMPFNSMIDASSITNLEEEWLYNYPEFLLTEKIDLHHQLKNLFDERSGLYKRVYESARSIIDNALESLQGTPPGRFSFTTIRTNIDCHDGFVASLPKQKTRRRKRGKRDIGASLNPFHCQNINGNLWNSIKESRSAMKAKKRFLWLPARSNPQTALLCWLASTESEKRAISLFFDRHAEYENHLWDETTMVLNTWQTEFHMCFWKICDKNQRLYEGLPHPLVALWPKGNNREFRRASMGFRFDGDFFDRYWTCHFVQYIPGLEIWSSDTPKAEWTSRFEDEKHCWQRKILELLLLQHMLNFMLNASNEILKAIEKALGIDKGILIYSVLTTEAYSSSADHWQIYEELLEKAEEDITSSLNTLSTWATREDDRGQERPRWTRNDERKYRGYINKLRSQTERQRWDLESCRDKMVKLRETLATQQAKSRSNLEAKREQNIRYFTYVTVIFLPLGFASSFYSMNGAPSNDLIVSLAKFSAAAFAITAILVFSVSAFITAGSKALSVIKDAVSVANNAVLRPLQQYSLHTRQKSLLVKLAAHDYRYNKTKSLDQAWFWPAYLFLELPTHTVALAWTALGKGDFSAIAVWRVVLGIVFLPIYAVSRAALTSFGNTAVLRKISRHLYHIYTKKLPKESRAMVDRAIETRIARQHHKKASGRTDDSGNITADDEEFPDHFKGLMPTTEPLQSLKTLESQLRERAIESIVAEMNKMVNEASGPTQR